MKQRRRLIIGAVVAALVVGVSLYAKYRVDLRPVATSGASKTFQIKAGENAPLIARRLYDAGLIRNRTSFVTYVNLHGLRAQLKVGSYSLAPTLSSTQIAGKLAGGQTITRRLVIPEGYRLSQVKTSATAVGLNAASFNAALIAPHSQTFLAGKPASVDLEGYLFPDSYEVGATSTSTQLVNAMLDNFARKVGPEYVQAFAAQGLTLHQGLTLASIVEREVSIKADRPIVAQIFLKRFKMGMPLGSDVTTQYASDLLGVPFNLDINSPYNTRRFAGLPPGPICSPGLGSLDAVAQPAKTDYLYFLSGKDGKTYYGKTYAEHQANIVRHL